MTFNCENLTHLIDHVFKAIAGLFYKITNVIIMKGPNKQSINKKPNFADVIKPYNLEDQITGRRSVEAKFYFWQPLNIHQTGSKKTGK